MDEGRRSHSQGAREAKAGVAKIAKTLKRTPGATAAKAHSMGVSLSMQ
jgi:hypothetical protein